jgi:hypothetical protein
LDLTHVKGKRIDPKIALASRASSMSRERRVHVLAYNLKRVMSIPDVETNGSDPSIGSAPCAGRVRQQG